MPRLNQILAIEKAIRNDVHRELSDAHHGLQKPALLAGIARTYTPKDDEGDQLPPESTRVQVNSEDMIKRTGEILTKLFDITAVKEWTNSQARADIMIGDAVLLKQVPVTYLLFLEKQLIDVHTFVGKLLVLDPAEDWHFDEAANAYASAPVQTIKTKKVYRNHEKTPATDKHPAQVEVYTEDVIIGTWRTIKLSGAVPALRVRQLLDRVEILQRAVKSAREQANLADAEMIKTGQVIFNYLFAE